MSNRSDVDCVKGRETGCQTYCCRLLVRLDPEERETSKDGSPSPSFVEKAANGYCIHLNLKENLCGIWHTRPRICREYTCNTDPLLQVALREPVTSMVQLVKKAQTVFIPKEQFLQIPFCGDE